MPQIQWRKTCLTGFFWTAGLCYEYFYYTVVGRTLIIQCTLEVGKTETWFLSYGNHELGTVLMPPSNSLAQWRHGLLQKHLEQLWRLDNL